METLVAAIAHYGYAILFAFIFLEVIGFPVPAAPVLMAARHTVPSVDQPGIVHSAVGGRILQAWTRGAGNR
jgi:membrane protein YqaA with SNARE-associated domain